MRMILALAFLAASAATTLAQAPAPFDMNPERSPENRAPTVPPAQAPMQAPAPVQTPAPRPATPPAQIPIPLAPAPQPQPAAPAQPSPQSLLPLPQSAPPQAVAPRPPVPVQPVQAPASPAQQAASAADLLGRRYLLPEADFRMSGEIEQRTWSLYLTPEQAAAPARLHLGYQNSIVVAPEASRLAILINDVPIYSSPVTSPEQVTDHVAEVPAGTLKAGINLVRFRSDQRHRTDCTIESTFELWTNIDAKRTFLSFDAPGMDRFVRLDDIRAVGVDDKARTRFRLIVPALDQLGATNVLMRLTQGLSLMGGMPNQSFTFEKAPSAVPHPGELAIFVGTHDELRTLLPGMTSAAANSAVASFIDYPGTNSTSALVLSGPSWPAVNGLIESFVASTDGSATQRRATLATQNWHGIDTPLLFADTVLDFTQLGVESQEFSGRLFRTSFTVGVPSDFYANAYGEARVLLDAAYTADVLPGSHIDIVVNGNIASTVPITSSGGAILRHLPIKLTMRHFKPGVNKISIEAALVTPQDNACAPGATAQTKPRFALFGSSQLEVPDFARIAQIPNLAATAGTGAPYRAQSEPVSLFMGRIDEYTLSAAATFLGKLSVASHHIIPVNVTISSARVGGANALFVGSVSDFPANILSQFKIDQESRNSWNTSGISQPSGNSSLTLSDWQQRSGNSFFARNFAAMSEWAKQNFDLSLAMLRFAPASSEFFTPPDTAKMIIAQESDPTDVGTWTAIISPDAASMTTGMEAFASRVEWDKLAGRITVFEGDAIEPGIVPVNRFRFMPTQPLSLGNARLVAANWLSDNIMSYALLLTAGGLLLGLATAGLLTLLGRHK